MMFKIFKNLKYDFPLQSPVASFPVHQLMLWLLILFFLTLCSDLSSAELRLRVLRLPAPTLLQTDVTIASGFFSSCG